MESSYRPTLEMYRHQAWVIVTITTARVIVIDGIECNVIVIESKVIVTELLLCLLQLNISIIPKFNFNENNQTKNSVF